MARRVGRESDADDAAKACKEIATGLLMSDKTLIKLAPKQTGGEDARANKRARLRLTRSGSPPAAGRTIADTVPESATTWAMIAVL